MKAGCLFLVIFIVLSLASIWAQPKKPVPPKPVPPKPQPRQELPGITLLRVTEMHIRYDHNKWGDEFFVAMAGEADAMLAGCRIVLSLWYYGERICHQGLEIKHTDPPTDGPVPFSYSWGPVNRAYEKVLAGLYELRADIQLDVQSPANRKKLEELLKNKQIRNEYKSMEWGTPADQELERKKMQEFYRDRLRKVHQLRLQLQHQVKLAMAVPGQLKKKAPHPYITETDPPRFDQQKWVAWRTEFRNDLARERKKHEKFHKTLFAFRYRTTQSRLSEYYDLLLHLSKLYGIRVFQANNVLLDRQDTNLDTFGIELPEVAENNLQSLLEEIVKELQLGAIDK